MADKLTDPFLLLHCGQNLDHLTFLSEPTLKILRQLHEAAAEPNAAPDLLSRCGDLDRLWRELLVDAVHALKACDKREKAYQKRFPINSARSKRAARDQNVYGIEELTGYFRSFSEFERVLYGSEGTYRDHITHVVRVWLTGVYLLTHHGSVDDLHIGFPVCSPIAVTANEARKRRIENANQVTPYERWAMWTVVALCHDLGYPLEKTHHINDAIEAMLAHFGNITVGRYRYSFQAHHQPLNEVTLRMISSRVEERERGRGQTELEAAQSGRYSTTVQPKYHTKFAHSFEEFHHGVISCLVLMKTLIYFMEADYGLSDGALKLEDARQFHIRREILRSIASHTCPEVYHLQINTLSFVLILCDELQGWGRPTFRDMRLGGVDSCDDVDIQIVACYLAAGRFEAAVEYRRREPSPEQVRGKFRLFHKWLRAAIDDQHRQINFRWQVTATGGKQHVFEYKSSRRPFEELAYTVDGKNATSKLWEEPQPGAHRPG